MWDHGPPFGAVRVQSSSTGRSRPSHLRGHKGRLWEGGVRVPGIAEWPGVLEAGTSVGAPISTSDYYPTVLALLGVADDGHANPIDGEDVFSVVKG
ncbi:MAG: sulfatase-like hydrolase/transferase [Pseudomonadota bacterium]